MNTVNLSSSQNIFPRKNSAIQKHKRDLSFKGYFACPLKELYIQPEEDPGYYVLAKELKDITHKAGIGLKMHLRGLVTDVPNDIVDKWFNFLKLAHYKHWSQDVKVFLQTNKGEIVSTNGITEDGLENSGELLAQHTGLQHKKMASFLDGGNFFIGKDNKGKVFAIVGMDSINKTCLKLAAHELGHKWQNTSDYYKTMREFVDANYVERNKGKYTEVAKKMIAQDLHLPEDRVHFIKQPNFHLDMCIRPLNYPYVLVNDPKLMLKELKKVYKNPDTDPDTKSRIKEYITKQFLELKKEAKEKNYAGAEATVKELQKLGLKPIKVPGGIYSTEVNYMNAIVHQKPDGSLFYITNKNYFPYFNVDLNKIFEDYIKQHVPQIKEIHYVNGDYDKYGDNYISRSIRDFKCGIHCMVTERPDFKAWA